MTAVFIFSCIFQVAKEDKVIYFQIETLIFWSQIKTNNVSQSNIISSKLQVVNITKIYLATVYGIYLTNYCS